MPNVYKLEYSTKAALETDLLSRGILQLNEEGEKIYAEGTHAIVHLGNIVLEAGKYDSQGNETKAPVISHNYHADIMTDEEFDFGANEVVISGGQPSAHNFA